LLRDSAPSFNPWDWIKELINRVANEHVPIEDLDGDRFSSTLVLFLHVE